jgi:hypothetical protein
LTKQNFNLSHTKFIVWDENWKIFFDLKSSKIHDATPVSKLKNQHNKTGERKIVVKRIYMGRERKKLNYIETCECVHIACELIYS